METTTLISILGILLTVIFGIITAIEFYRHRRYPGRLTYIQLNSVNLLNRIANQFDDIRLTHRNYPIDTNLIYIKGAIANTGSIDINKHHDTNSIFVKLPEGCEWLDIKTTKTSNDLSSNITIEEPTKARLTFDILKRNEYVVFESIIKASSDIKNTGLDSLLTFNHRYENTDKIEQQSINRNKIRRFTGRIVSYMLILVIAALSYSLFRTLVSHRTPIVYATATSPSQTYYAFFNDKGMIELEENDIWHGLRLWSSSENIITPERFKNEFSPVTATSTFHDKLFYIIVVELLLVTIAIVSIYLRRRKSKNLLRLIGE